MKFDDLDKKMRVFETHDDKYILPEMYIVARIDGRNFTKLTKEKHDFEKPFDLRFHDYMVETVRHLMTCGFNIVYGYTQSDEISLLFHLQENAFSRKERKYNSILAAEASARFSTQLGDIGTFDCRICQLPNSSLVSDYFRWRHEDAHRNSLSAHCYWLLRGLGHTAVEATERINKLSSSDKNELLFAHGINFNDLPTWQKRGSGIYWKEVTTEGYNPVKKEAVQVQRRVLFVDRELPMGLAYNEFIQQFTPTVS
ncbi:tRNA(His) 5'-end guanylyltransferase [Chitinophaga dinghuensis]|uniref:tRNA(His) guanylyltransferase n=1 Tax=Chitinophaga dinghuensis TaxID=1539050 RepID=A0A327W304_9BACT|nr:tRNA(His) guanylyltransferase Thg1 family protein [Chitinophaga dinghuensis]RAJ83639.1 tRNA(His) 5'-end guanylyltransferase [Chitinophaga dinghuensis]